MMFKRLASLILIFVLVQNLQAQTLEYKLRLLSMQNKPMPGVEITLIETVDRTVIKGRTDNSGRVSFTIKGGVVWQMNILDIKNYYKWQIVMPEYEGTREMTLTYTPEKILREMKAPADRSSLNIKTEQQNLRSIPKPTPQTNAVQINYAKNNGQPLTNFPVRLTCIRLEKAYLATTDERGSVFFSLPNNEEFEIDLEGVDNFDYIKTFNRPTEMKLNKVFEPYPFNDVITNSNTILQNIPTDVVEGTSHRHLFMGYFSGDDGQTLANTTVYLREMDGKKVYQVQTDEEGIGRFMLPKGKKYGLLYAKITDEIEYITEAIDLTRAWGIGHSQKQVIVPDYKNNKARLPQNLTIQTLKDVKTLNDFFAGNQLQFNEIRNLSHKTHEYASILYQIKGQPNPLGIQKGFLLTNGNVLNAFGLNDSPSASWASSPYAVTDRVPSIFHNDSTQIYDANILEWSITPSKSQLTIEYIFASEEYCEFLEYDDGFGIFIEGEGFDSNKNLALLPDKKTPISVITVNPQSQSNYFIENNQNGSDLFNYFQYDGFTKKSSITLPVKPQSTYKIKVVIFDRRDAIYDSGLFVNFYAK